MSIERRVFAASAPSNIALIKYMGKIAGAGNKPTNASVSYTLGHLRTYVELVCTSPADHADYRTTGQAADDRWEPLSAWNPEREAASVRAEDWALDAAGSDRDRPGIQAIALEPIALSEKGQKRFLAHLQALKEGWGYRGSFTVRSANGFPSDCGLASSASSFAALTTAAAHALSVLTDSGQPKVSDLAELSRRGSGSSCRSFFKPWGLWTEAGVSSLDLAAKNLICQTVVVSDSAKTVSSSDAHRRVAQSSLFPGRIERAHLRLGLLISALSSDINKDSWKQAYEVAWAEFQDMHALFETSAPPFGYLAPGSIEALTYARQELWARTGDGPLVTMDAGANVHFLFRRDQVVLAEQVKRELGSRYRVIAGE